MSIQDWQTAYARLPAAVRENEPALIPPKVSLRGGSKTGPGRRRKSSLQTAVMLNFQKCNFPVEAEDRLQRDIFVIGFRSDVISRETFVTLTFAQVIAKARDFKDGLKTESSVAQHHLEEAVDKISSNKIP